VPIVVTGALLGILALLAGVAPAFAENPCNEETPHDLADVIGYTWSGTITSIKGAQISMKIDHVYANGGHGPYPLPEFRAGNTLLLVNDDCSRVFGLSAGPRYLMSTHDPNPWVRPDGTQIHTIVRPEFIAWELHGSKASLVDSGGLRPFLPEFLKPRTLTEALALIAPDAVMPPTDAAPYRAPDLPDSTPWLPVVFGTVAGFAWFLKTRVA
jgi:hypothetical protein